MSNLVIIVNALHVRRSKIQKVAQFLKKNCKIVTLLNLATFTTFFLHCCLTEISITSLNMPVTTQVFPVSTPITIIYVRQTQIRRPGGRLICEIFREIILLSSPIELCGFSFEGRYSISDTYRQ